MGVGRGDKSGESVLKVSPGTSHADVNSQNEHDTLLASDDNLNVDRQKEALV